MNKVYNITSKHLNNHAKMKELWAQQKSDFSDEFPHPVNEIWGPGSMLGDQYYRVIGTLRNYRDYGEYCTDFIEENALELYLNGINLGQVGVDVRARNPIEFGMSHCDHWEGKTQNLQNTNQNVAIKTATQKQKQPLSDIIRLMAFKMGEE